MSHPLSSMITVLVEPQKAENVGAALRALRNMGLPNLRLVAPPPLDWSRLPVVAPRSNAEARAIEVFDTLDAALADGVYIVGCTARQRASGRPVLSPRDAAAAALARAAHGRVLFLFGREDFGLSNADLDRCHALLTIPTAPEYPSLNLAQAVLIVAYELRLAAADAPPSPLSDPPASAAATDALFADIERALIRLDFLVPSRATATMRALRALLLRAGPTAAETRLLRAILRAITRRLGSESPGRSKGS